MKAYKETEIDREYGITSVKDEKVFTVGDEDPFAKGEFHDQADNVKK
jgi:hypothetical protein